MGVQRTGNHGVLSLESPQTTFLRWCSSKANLSLGANTSSTRGFFQQLQYLPSSSWNRFFLWSSSENSTCAGHSKPTEQARVEFKRQTLERYIVSCGRTLFVWIKVPCFNSSKKTSGEDRCHERLWTLASYCSLGP